MALETPLWLGAVPPDGDINYSARQLRTFVDALVTAEGVCGLGDLKIGQHAGGSDGTVDAATGSCVIKGDNSTGQGKYLQRNTAVYNVTDVPGIPGSGTRHHLVAARVRDKQSITGDSTYDWIIYTVPDVGSGRPGTPNNAIPLAEVRRYPGQTSITNSDIDDLRPYATGLDSSLYTSKAAPPWDRRVGHGITTAADGSYNWPHSLGRLPAGGLGTVCNFQAVSGLTPMGVIVDLDSATTTHVKIYVTTPQAFGLYPSRSCTVSVLLW